MSQSLKHLDSFNQGLTYLEKKNKTPNKHHSSLQQITTIESQRNISSLQLSNWWLAEAKEGRNVSLSVTDPVKSDRRRKRNRICDLHLSLAQLAPTAQIVEKKNRTMLQKINQIVNAFRKASFLHFYQVCKLVSSLNWNSSLVFQPLVLIAFKG